MPWLLENPIGSMWGPAFLAFYFMAFCMALAVCWLFRSSLDPTLESTPLPVPVDPDPYQIAYLRGGEGEVLRLATVDLYQRDLLTNAKSGLFSANRLQAKVAVVPQDLNVFQRELLDYYREPRLPGDMYRAHLRPRLAAHFATWDAWIDAEQLQYPATARATFRLVKWVALAGFLLLGGYKFVAAISSSRPNVGFLIMMIVAGGIAIQVWAKLPRFTTRGRRYIDDLQTAYASYKNPSWDTPALANSSPSNVQPAAYSLPVMAVGLFGVAVLQHSPLDFFYSQYAAASSVGSSCGSSCGGGSSSSCGGGGSSCGSGCGGCGGGD